MIISVDKIKELVTFNGWTDEKIRMKLLAVEQTIRAYTNNNFQDRGCRVRTDIAAGVFMSESLIPFSVGDTIQISDSRFNGGLFTVSEVSNDTTFMVDGDPVDEDDVLVTRVKYPADVIACAVNLMEWEVNNRAKVGVQSETLSRHSVTYFNMDGANNVMGYPASLLGCLKPYRKARC
jgi:hypothetical protein